MSMRPHSEESESEREAFASHLDRPLRRGHLPAGAHTGAAGGAACGDLIRISLTLDESSPEGVVLDAGFDASGCGASIAAGSATVGLVLHRPLLDAARVGAEAISNELGGLSQGKLHAAELAADALHRALGAAARSQARLAAAPQRTIVAMSGGVDSAVAALIVAREGEEAVAVTLELWADQENDAQRSCCSADAVRNARALAHKLGLPHLSLDLREEFRAGVVEPWLAEHAAGLTPYPCVRCNGFVRLDGMLQLASRLGAERLVTGHYARLRDGLLHVATDERKDQSYALAALSLASLARLRFPLGELRKDEVRKLAKEAALAVAKRPDSQDLCFLAGTTQQDFLARHGGLRRRDGQILSVEGEVLGTHEGVHRYTIGQRHGLRIGGGAPLYVLHADAASNTLTVGSREGLLTNEVEVSDAVLHRDGDSVDAVKIRYRGGRIACGLTEPLPAGRHERLTVRLPRPLERTAGGQLACLYSGGTVVGHGTIVAS